MKKIIVNIVLTVPFLFFGCDPAGTGTPEQQKHDCYEASIPIFLASATDTIHTAQEKQNILTVVLWACSKMGEY